MGLNMKRAILKVTALLVAKTVSHFSECTVNSRAVLVVFLIDACPLVTCILERGQRRHHTKNQGETPGEGGAFVYGCESVAHECPGRVTAPVKMTTQPVVALPRVCSRLSCAAR